MVSVIEHQRVRRRGDTGRRSSSSQGRFPVPDAPSAAGPRARQRPVSRRRGRSRVVRTPTGIAASPRGRLASLLRGIPRWEAVLMAALILAVLIPLVLQLWGLGVPREEILLPRGVGGQGALADYLIPPDSTPARQGLTPQALKSLSITGYTVKRGDTLSGIAQRFRLNLDTIISYNNIRDARALRAGTRLEVPSSDGIKYTVRRGDALSVIARRFGVPLNGILDWNDLDSELILPGAELFIPNARLGEMELNRVLGRLFIFPTRGRVTSRFGNRKDPFTGVRRFHNGLDIANRAGTAIHAAMSGRVAMLGYNPNFGKYIILSHPEGFQTLYGHLSQFRVSRGERISQGQTIGIMGNTGYSTGPHLHFSIFRRGEPVDPYKFLH